LSFAGGYEWVVRPRVIEVDWDENYIVAKRDLRTDRRRADDENEEDAEWIRWYIIDVQNETRHGPFSYESYLEQREELKIPAELELQEP
jgi:hypothetical protein